MNGRFTQELSKVDLLTASGEILRFSPDDEDVVENSYLACLSRRPSPEELQFFTNRLATAADSESGAAADQTSEDRMSDRRQQVVEDMYWTLFNSPEFSWNH
jgi:hypothetical protein